MSASERKFNWLPWFWGSSFLIYFVFLLAYYRGVQELAGGAMLLTCLAFYLFDWRENKLGTHAVLVTMEMIIAAVLGALFNPGFAFLLTYPMCSIMAKPDTGRWRWRLAAGILLTSVVMAVGSLIFLRSVFVQEWPLLFAAFLTALGSGLSVRLMSHHMVVNEQLRKANAEIERLTRLAERDRISRDLHDVMGHHLAQMALQSQLAARLLPDRPQLAKDYLTQIEQTARRALAEVREYVHDVRCARLEDEWSDALHFARTAGLEVELCGDPCAVQAQLGPNRSQALAFALREAVTNVVRHSGASHLHVLLKPLPGRVQLVVTDDGCGADTVRTVGVPEPGSARSSQLDSPPSRIEPARTGSGIPGMQARIAAVGGALSLVPGTCAKGLQVMIELPTDSAPPVSGVALKVGTSPS
jgi:two-component system sensor histidine kinase DesK